MTNISKRKIKSPDYKLVEKELLSLLTKLNKQTAHSVTHELLTDAERIMLVKRFGAVFMFTQAYSPYRVSETLGMSPPTACRIFEQYCEGQFKGLLASVSKKETNRFLEVLEDLIMAQVSSRARTRLLNRALK